MTKYVDNARTLEILKQDSGLLPKPRGNWKTFTPKKDDIAFVSGERQEYKFDGTEWVKYEAPKEDVEKGKKRRAH